MPKSPAEADSFGPPWTDGAGHAGPSGGAQARYLVGRFEPTRWLRSSSFLGIALPWESMPVPRTGTGTPGTTGAFYHDGRFATLLDVVNHYDAHFGLLLSEQEKGDLVEYLKSL